MMNFSQVVLKSLKERDMNPTDLARKTDYTPQYIHNLLDGNRRWNEESMKKVCDVLGLEVKYTKREEGANT